MRVSQEFYCGECQGYFLVRLNMALNIEVEVACPNCGHKHRRVISGGRIHETGRFTHDATEIILVPRSTYSKQPRTQAMIKAHETRGLRRDGIVVGDEEIQAFMADRWLEKAGADSDGR